MMAGTPAPTHLMTHVPIRGRVWAAPEPMSCTCRLRCHCILFGFAPPLMLRVVKRDTVPDSGFVSLSCPPPPPLCTILCEYRSISLPGNGLNGSLPSTLGDLTALTYVEFLHFFRSVVEALRRLALHRRSAVCERHPVASAVVNDAIV